MSQRDLQMLPRLSDSLSYLYVEHCIVDQSARAIELFDKGVITERDTGGLRLNWGDTDAIMQLVEAIARREGFGALLADGARAMRSHFGSVVDEAMVWSKRLPQSDAVDVRGHKGFALGVATSTRGADHLRSRPTLEALNLSAGQLRKIFKAPVSPDSTSYEGKAEMVRQTESLFAVSDAIGICRFVVQFNSPDLLGIDELTEYVNAACGLGLTSKDLKTIGERIGAIERLWIARRTGGENLDGLPSRYSEPMPGGRFRGESIESDAFQAALTRFYELSGIDPASGAPLASTLAELGIDDELLHLI